MLSRIGSRWKPVITGFRNHKMIHQSSSFMDKAMVETTTRNDNDSMLPTIKSASNAYELLNVISKNVKKYSAEETLTALKSLFELQKNTNTSVNRDDIARNSDYERLCRSLKRNARHLELNYVIEALNIISYVGTSANSEITMSLLNLIKYKINDVTLGHIILLSFLLKRMDSNPLVDVLQLALPVLLQIQISTKFDYENVTQLTELLRFVARYRVSDQCIMNIVNSLVLHGEDLSLDEARSILWSLSTKSLRIQNASCDKLLTNSIKVMKQHFYELDISAVQTTLEKMIEKYMSDRRTFEKFYDEAFYNKCADFVVTKDLGFENASYVQRKLNKLRFTNIKLLMYMIREVEKYPAHIVEGTPIGVLTFVTALSQGNFKPNSWDKVRSSILQSSLLTSNERLTLPWNKCSIELLSLGIECPAIWDRVFSDDFHKTHLTTHKDKNRQLLHMLELYQYVKVMTDYDVDNKLSENYLIEAKKLMLSIVEHPMQQHLELAFGGPSFVYTKVQTHLGHVIDHVIVFDKETMEPIAIEDGRNSDVFYEDITVDGVTKEYIAVVSLPEQCYCINIPILRGIYELKLRTFEKMGISAVVLNPTTFNGLEDDEKIPYIQREVRLKLCGNPTRQDDSDTGGHFKLISTRKLKSFLYKFYNILFTRNRQLFKS